MPRHVTPLPQEVRDLAARQAALISARQWAGLGLTPGRRRRSALAGYLIPAVARVYHVPGAVTAPTTRSDLLDHRRRRAAMLGLLAYGPRAISTGSCALFLAGVQGVPADVTLEVALRGGGSAASNTGTAVALMDSALNRGLLGDDGLARAHDLARYHDEVARTHGWWGQADARAESPAETFGRLNCVDANIRPDALQLVVLDCHGHFLGRVEFGWLLPDGRWLLVEVDRIDIHGTSAAIVRGLHRQNGVIIGSTLLRRYTGTDAMNGRLTAEVAPILQGARRRPGSAVHGGPLVLPATPRLS